MSFNAMLKHRCTIMRLTPSQVDGKVGMEWKAVASGLRCFLDLNFLRQGKDQGWVDQAGRPQDRTGVLFLTAKAPIKSGDRIITTRGPLGTFEIQSAIDEAWRPTNRHHLEIGVMEIGRPLDKGEYSVG